MAITLWPTSPPPPHIAQFVVNDLDILLEELTTLDLTHNYPNDPSEVVRIFNRTFWLLYHWDRQDEYILSRVLQIQRQLYAQALRDANPFTTQLATLLVARNELEQLNIHIIDIYQDEPIPDRFNPQDRLTIHTSRFADNNQIFHYNIHLFKHPQTQRWEIGFWVEN